LRGCSSPALAVFAGLALWLVQLEWLWPFSIAERLRWHVAACDKSWDALHRLLTDGELGCGNGRYPWSHVVLGPKQLHEADDYFISFVSPEQVRDVAAALQPITRESFAERYRTIVPRDYVLLPGPAPAFALRTPAAQAEALSLGPDALTSPDP